MDMHSEEMKSCCVEILLWYNRVRDVVCVQERVNEVIHACAGVLMMMKRRGASPCVLRAHAQPCVLRDLNTTASPIIVYS